jgi:hypothetical protein
VLTAFQQFITELGRNFSVIYQQANTYSRTVRTTGSNLAQQQRRRLQLDLTSSRYVVARLRGCATTSLRTFLRLVLRLRTSKYTSFLLVIFLVGQNSGVMEVGEFT